MSEKSYSFIDFVEIKDSLNDSKKLQKEFQRKASVLMDAIKILEDDNIPIPESIYGLCDAYKAQLNLESNHYNQLLKIMSRIKEERNVKSL